MPPTQPVKIGKRSIGSRYRPLLCAVGVAVLASGNAQALTTHDLRGAQLQPIYGTYAPQGNCQREPRIVVDESGFSYQYGGQVAHPRTFEWAVSYGGPEYQGISLWFFPFVVNDNDFGRVLMTVNPNEKVGTLSVEADLAKGQSLPRLQAALVSHSPYARCKGTAPAATPARPVTPAPATTAIALDWSNLPTMVGKHQGEFDLFGPGPIAAALQRLLGTRLGVLRRNLDVAGPLAREGHVYYLSGNAPHRGDEDMAYVLIDGARHAVQVGIWEHGKLRVYAPPGGRIAPPGDIRHLLERSPPESAVAGPGMPWQTRSIAGRPPLALALAAASTSIKSLSVFCDHGRPLLAMLLHRAPPSTPLTFTMVFRGGLVDLPMGRGNREATLWMADLRGSPLPRLLSSQTGVAYLRLNGTMQGELSMQGAAVASRAALAGCGIR